MSKILARADSARSTQLSRPASSTKSLRTLQGRPTAKKRPASASHRTASCVCGAVTAAAVSLGQATAMANERCENCRILFLVKSKGMSMKEARQWILKENAAKRAKKGGSEADDGIWRQGLLGVSRPVQAKANKSGGIRYLPCRTYVHPPSKFRLLPEGEDQHLPDAALDTMCVFGYKGSQRRDNVHFIDSDQITYFVAAVGVVRRLSSNTQRLFYGHDDDISSMAIHPSRKVAATGQLGRDPKVCVWDLRTMDCLAEISGYFARSVQNVCFSGDGRRLLAVSGDDFHSVFVFEFPMHATPGQGIDELDYSAINPAMPLFSKFRVIMSGRCHGSHVSSVLFNWCEDGEDEFVNVGDKHVKFWNVQTGVGKNGAFGNTYQKDGPGAGPGMVTCAAWINAGEIATGSSSYCGDILHWRAGKVQSRVKGAHKGGCTCLLWDGDNRSLYSGGKDGYLRVWTQTGPKSWAQRHAKDVHPVVRWCKRSKVSAVAMSKYGRMLAIGLECCHILVWDTVSDAASLVVEGHSAHVMATAPLFEEKSHQVVSVGRDCFLRVWDLKLRRCVARQQLPGAGCGVDVTRDNMLVAIGMSNGGICVWKMESLMSHEWGETNSFVLELSFGAGHLSEQGASVNVIGTAGSSGWIKLKQRDGKGFGAKTTDSFDLHMQGSIGNILKTQIRLDGKDPKSKLSLDQAEFRLKGESVPLVTKGVECSGGGSSVDLLPVTQESDLKETYVFEVVTGDVNMAGTDAEVRVQVIGVGGQTGLIPLLKSETHKDPFERGHTDRFTVEGAAVGQVTKLIVSHNGAGFAAGWHLESIFLTCKQSNQRYKFSCDRWLEGSTATTYLFPESQNTFAVVIHSKMQSSTLPQTIILEASIVGNEGLAGPQALVPLNKEPLISSGGKSSSPFIAFGAVGKITAVDIKMIGETPINDYYEIDLMEVINESTGQSWQLQPGDGIALHNDNKKIRLASVMGAEGTLRNASSFKPSATKPSFLGAEDPAINESEADAMYVKVSGGFKSSLQSNGLIFFARHRSEDIDCVRFSPDGKVLASGSHDNTIDIYRVGRSLLKGQKYKRIGVLTGHSSYITHLDFSWDGMLLRSTCGANELLYWSLPECKQNPNGSEIRDVAWSTSTCSLGWQVSGIWPPGSDGTDINGVDALLDAGQSGSLMATTKPRGSRGLVATADDFGMIKLFRFPCIGPCAQYRAYIGHSSHVLDCRFTSDGNCLVSAGSLDLSLQVWGVCTPDNPLGGYGAFGSTPWSIVVETGAMLGAGTSANVFIKLFGDTEQTFEQQLLNPINTDMPFARSASAEFNWLVPVALGNVDKVRVWHDGSGMASGWFLEAVVVTNMDTNESWRFSCGRWLDGSKKWVELTADGFQTQYMITVVTGSDRGAGTDSKVSIQLHGDHGESEAITLSNSKTSKFDKFERGDTDIFDLELRSSVGDLQSATVMMSGDGLLAAWQLDHIIIEEVTTQRKFYLWGHLWFKSPVFKTRLQAGGPEPYHYTITIKTSDVFGAGTDSMVWYEVIGDKSRSGLRVAADSKTSSNKFERNSRDVFDLFTGADLGTPKEFILYMDASGLGAAWDVDHVVVRDELLGAEAEFPASCRLDKSNTKAILKPLSESGVMIVRVKTGDLSGAGTDANVFAALQDENGWTGEAALSATVNGKSDKFERNNLDEFKISFGRRLGRVLAMRVRTDMTGAFAEWYLEYIEIVNPGSDDKAMFVVGRWLNKQTKELEMLPGKESSTIEYTVTVVTGNERGAGTNANVFCTLFGTDGSSPEVALKKSQNMDKFERGQEDVFSVILGRPIGLLQRCRIRSDDSGMSSSWLLDRIVVEDSKGSKTIFASNQWLDKQIKQVDLLPGDDAKKIFYIVKIFTGDVNGAGTNSNVFVELFGEDGSSGELALKNSLDHTDKFERGNVDTFRLQLGSSLGELMSIVVRKDNSGILSKWFLSKVVVETEDGKMGPWEFLAESWIDKKVPQMRLQPGGIRHSRQIRVSLFTADVKGAGTDANMFIELFGDSAETGILALKESQDHRDKFERGQKDTFLFTVGQDLGQLFMARLSRDKTIFGGDYLLEKCVVEDVTSGRETELVNSDGEWLTNKRPFIELLSKAGEQDETLTRKRSESVLKGKTDTSQIYESLNRKSSAGSMKGQTTPRESAAKQGNNTPRGHGTPESGKGNATPRSNRALSNADLTVDSTVQELSSEDEGAWSPGE